MPLYKRVIVFIAFVALFGTVTNYVYFSPLLTIFLPLSVYVLNKEKIYRPIAWLYFYLALFLVSTALYHPVSFVEFGFYRRDGNFLISFAPLLVLPLFSIRFNLERGIRLFFSAAVILYAAVFFYEMGFGFSLDSLDLFGGLFHAQNAVGGFLAILGSLSFAYWYRNRTKKHFFIFILIFTMLVMTYSRGSIIGLMMAIPAWYLAIHDRKKWIMVLLAFPVLLTIGSLMVGYPYYQNVLSSGDKAEFDFESGIETKNANVLIRVFYTFPRAYYSFLHSPVTGTGVGSFDDRPYQFEEIVPYVSYNAQPQKIHSDNHAHHSYLHILAEQGVIGLLVFLTFWYFLFIYLLQLPGQHLVRDFLLIAYFSITFASFTEHRITTPSMMLPFTIPLALLMAREIPYRRYKIEVADANGK